MTNKHQPSFSASTIIADVSASVVVFLVAVPLCLGIAVASGAPPLSGLIAGIIGGIVVGSLSGSHVSVSGPAAGLTAIVITQIERLGAFDAFLLAVSVAGVLQIAMGLARAGALAAFFPSSVIKGLLAAIGVILILKQIPHLFGHDTDPEGEMSYVQPDGQTTFSELWTLIEGQIHLGAAVVGLLSIAILLIWDRVKFLKKSPVPGPLVAVVVGVLLQLWFRGVGEPWAILQRHLIDIPVTERLSDLKGLLTFPDFSVWNNPAVYVAGVTIAIVASLETLLNLEAADSQDRYGRHSPPNRELLAQGTGNLLGGLVGALPVTSVIVRSSVNINTGARTKLSAILHGVLLVTAVVLLPVYMNMIPLAALAAILIVTGFKLASPTLFREMWKGGRYQFIPFIVTLVTIVRTDLLIGILVGLGVSLLFILNSNLRRPIRRTVETRAGGDVLHVELANQVSFLNRAALATIFDDARPESHLLIDASETDYIDPDVLTLIRDFRDHTAPARGVTVSLRGFRDKYELKDQINFHDHSSRKLQKQVTPQEVLEILREGNRRFTSGQRLTRDMRRQILATASSQFPLAAVLSCIDSRVPVELILDAGIGDVFSVRVAGNVIGTKSLGSIEYGVAVAGIKLVLVLGHTRCGAVTSAVDMIATNQNVERATGCSNLQVIVDEIGHSVEPSECRRAQELDQENKENFVDEVARRNVLHVVEQIRQRSSAIRQAADGGRIIIVGALYDVKSGEIDFMSHDLEPSGMETAHRG